MNDFFTGVLPWLLWVGRIALSAVAVLLLIRCGRTLLSGGKQESWGFLSLSNGARYPLYHWENMIGRARQADIRINFPSVSRSHAALCRDSEGIWRIYPIRTGGTLLNGTVVERPTALNPGDALSMGGVDIYFFPDQKQARRPVRTAASPGTLWLLTLFQVLMFLQFLPGLTAGASLPVCIGFGGLVLLSWVFCSLRRTGSRGLEILALLLTTVGFAVTAASGQTEALRLLEGRRFHLALLDVTLPDGSGFALCAAIKAQYHMPVMFLTALADESSTVAGLELGGDDYIAKPFRPRELVSRIRNVLRRYGGGTGPLRLGPIRVDAARGVVTKDGRELPLSPLEYRLLLLFCSNPGVVLSRSRILDEIWDLAGDFVTDNTLTVYMKRLRDKIEPDPQNPTLIRTIRGQGYKAEDCL